METRESITTVRKCPICTSGTTFTLDAERYRRWLDGEFIQNVWPEWSPEERELLISGTHPACWAELFGEEES